MPHEIKFGNPLVEVKIWGETCKEEVLQIIRKLHEDDPEKEKQDLWLVAAESMVPFDALASIAEVTGELVGRKRCKGRSAIVAANVFHKARLDLYSIEAAILPFPLKVFLSKDEALKWLADGG
jgi:hypothetical protein